MWSPASDKVKLFAEDFSKKSNLDDSCIYFHVFPSRNNLKLHNISVTHKMVKNVIMKLDFSKTSGPDFCIPMVVLVFQISGRFYRWSLYLRMLGTAKRYRPVSLPPVVSKVFEKLLSNKIVDHLEKFALFFGFEYGFRSCRSTSDLLTVVSDRTSRAFNRSGASGAVALDT